MSITLRGPKICIQCHQPKDCSEFYRSGIVQSNVCRDCTKKSRASWEKYERKLALEAYGHKCVCCGEDRFEFLSFDHPNGGGESHRRQVGVGANFVKWPIKNRFPKGIVQILCHNCNSSFGYYGYCPHHPEVKRERNWNTKWQSAAESGGKNEPRPTQ